MINIEQYETLKNNELSGTKSKFGGSETLKNRYTATCRFVWNPQPRTGDIIQTIKPDIEGCLTPRQAKKAIALGRTFDKDLWYPAKHRLDDIASKYDCKPSMSVMKDQERGKFVKKVQRKKYKKIKQSLGELNDYLKQQNAVSQGFEQSMLSKKSNSNAQSPKAPTPAESEKHESQQ